MKDNTMAKQNMTIRQVSTTHKDKDWGTRTPIETGVDSGANSYTIQELTERIENTKAISRARK
jgi:hypothetical protein